MGRPKLQLLPNAEGGKDFRKNIIRRSLAENLAEIAQRAMQSHENQVFTRALPEQMLGRSNGIYCSVKQVVVASIHDYQAFWD